MTTRRDMLKIGAGMAVAAASVEIHAASAQAPGGQAWLYSATNGPGAFQEAGDRQWVETTPTGDRLTFEETAHTNRYLELRDRGRGLWLRIHDQFAEFRYDPDNAWSRLYDGGWVPPDKLPPLSD